MLPAQISANQYAGMQGFGAGPALSQGDLDDLNKALTAGSAINNPGASPGEGFPLRVESLERTLKNVTYRMEHIRLWKQLPKLAAYNTVEEHNEISAYGQGEEGFVAETQLPETDDTTYERKTATIKYLGTTREVSHVASLIKPAHGNVIANETVAGTMWLLRVLERALFKADSSLSGLQFDGYEKLIQDSSPAANIIDMRGQPLDEDKLVDGALTISDEPNYGIPTHMHMNPKVKADLVKTFFPKERYDLFDKTSGGMVGLDIKGFTSPAGDVQFEPNVFINDGGAPLAAYGDGAKRPASPSVTAALATAPDAASQFALDDAGTYTYSITAHNDFGRSAPVAVGAIAVAQGDKVSMGITAGAGNSPATLWYQLYRSKPDGSELRLIKRLPNTTGAAELTIEDLNEDLPFTTSAYMWQQNLEAMSWKQLAPFIKIPLATTGPVVRWMQFVYGVPVLYAPGKALLFKNVGRASGFVGQP